jgi:hypothetical protein
MIPAYGKNPGIESFDLKLKKGRSTGMSAQSTAVLQGSCVLKTIGGFLA